MAHPRNPPEDDDYRVYPRYDFRPSTDAEVTEKIRRFKAGESLNLDTSDRRPISLWPYRIER